MPRISQFQHLLVLFLLALLSGCGVWNMINPPPPAPPPLDPQAQSGAILTCNQIAVERNGIAESLRHLTQQPTPPPADEIARLNRVDRDLAQLAASKRCPAPIPPQ